MIFRKMSRHGLSLTITFVLSSANLIGLPMLAQANSSELWNIKNSSQTELDFSRHGRPGKRTAGASRSPDLLKTHLTALVPVIDVSPKEVSGESLNETSQEFVLGLTVSEHPTFWFHIPSTSEQDTLGEFVLLDEDDNVVVQQSVILSEKPGIAGFRLPPSSKPLEIGKSYHWYFSVIVSHRRPSRNPFVHGQVTRVSLTPSLENRLQQATPQERIALYTNNGIWHEAATLLAEAHYADSSNANLAAWDRLLRSVGLEALSREAIVGKLQPAEPPIGNSFKR